MKNNKKVGLSLSGGGYRATAYHLGTLKKLKELDLLDAVDVISTNSGGSITGATFGLYGDDFDEFERVILKGLKSSVIAGVLTSWRFLCVFALTLIWIGAVFYFLFTSYQWVSLLLVIAFILIFALFQFQLFPISKLNERMYNRFFFKGKTLSDLLDSKLFAINATNLETGRLFTFSKARMGDSSYEYPKDDGKKITFQADKFPIAKAVAASTCVPFVFTPIKIAARFYTNLSDVSRAKPRLVDGGVYDNQAAHKLTQDHTIYSSAIVIISDAGNEIPFKHTYRNTLTLLIRTSSVFMNRIKNMQMVEHLYRNSKIGQREIAYQSLGWDLENSIPQFIEGIKDGVILKHVLKSHQITQSMIDNKEWVRITELLKINCNYNAIIKQANTKEELAVARAVKTNLVTLKDEQINPLIKHASCMTEIQMRLYCPSLFN